MKQAEEQVCAMCVTAIGDRYTTGLRDQFNWLPVFSVHACKQQTSSLQVLQEGEV